VNTAVGQMDQITQQNAAMVEEATAASHSLKSEAEQLKGFIDRFKTSVSAAPVATLGSTPRSAARVRKAPTSAPARSIGSAALKMKPSEQAADESWAEF